MKILIIRLGSLGDVVLSMPVVAAVKGRYPDAEVDFLVKKEYYQLPSGNPLLRKVISYEGNGRHKGIKGLLGFIGEIKEEGYTHVVDLHGNLRSRIISALLPGSKTYRYEKQAMKRRLLLWGLKLPVKHTVEAYFAALKTLSAGADFKSAPTIHLSGDEENAAEEFLKRNGILKDAFLIGLSPGAKWPTKMWLEDGFIKTGKQAVKELDARILVFGGPDDAGLIKRVAEGVGREALAVSGTAGLKVVAALMRRCRVLLTNDSGLMHMATAVDTPVVAVFGPTVQGFGFAPLGKSVVVEKDLKCRPCSLHGSERCPKGHFECMKGIDAGEVFETVKEMASRQGIWLAGG